MPYVGTARTDFPGGSSKKMYDSIQKLYSFPDNTRIFVGHDYPPPNEQPCCQTTVGDEKKRNIMIQANTSLDDYVTDREAKNDLSDIPRYLYPSIQINLRSGSIGSPEKNAQYYYKVPLHAPSELM